MSWDIAETRNLIREFYGCDQLELSRPSLNSLEHRQFYARYHYQRAYVNFKRYEKKYLKRKDFLEISFGIDQEEWQRFNVVVRKIAADITACVQSIHSIPDILSSAIYYSLALDKIFDIKVPRNGINHYFVSRNLQKLDGLECLGVALENLTKSDKYKHLSALSNRSKHESIVVPAINGDLTGTRKIPYIIKYPSFSYKGDYYKEVDVSDILPDVYLEISKGIVNCGIILNKILEKK